ncbi:hypothetical protein ACLOJK_019838 [Asimina triloba]
MSAPPMSAHPLPFMGSLVRSSRKNQTEREIALDLVSSPRKLGAFFHLFLTDRSPSVLIKSVLVFSSSVLIEVVASL